MLKRMLLVSCLVLTLMTCALSFIELPVSAPARITFLGYRRVSNEAFGMFELQNLRKAVFHYYVSRLCLGSNCFTVPDSLLGETTSGPHLILTASPMGVFATNLTQGERQKFMLLIPADIRRIYMTVYTGPRKRKIILPYWLSSRLPRSLGLQPQLHTVWSNWIPRPEDVDRQGQPLNIK